jgi:uncharacterized membrane protein
MVRSRVLVVAGFAVWTFVIWVGRIRNVVDDDDLTGGGRTVRLVLAAVFIVGAVVVAALLPAARRAGKGVERLRTAVDVVAAVTIGVWAVRGVGILLDEDHTGGFKVVHTALALVSISLALLAWRATQKMEGVEAQRVIPD